MRGCSTSIRRALGQVQRSVPLRESPELSSAVHWTPSQDLPVHRWFRYREGFSPDLLAHFPSSTARLDPFCGCGTTLLESARMGQQSCGVDVNPLATFVARTKTKHYSRRDGDNFQGLAEKAALADHAPAPVPPFELVHKLFLPESLDVLLRLKAFIDSTSPPKVRDLLLLAWLSILEQASNVFKEGNGLKYRNKKRRPGTYVTLPDRVWIPRHFGSNVTAFVRSLWNDKCSEIAHDIHSRMTVNGCPPRIRTGSCLDGSTLDFGVPVGLAIFSPPYANRFDYFESFKVELWMGGFVRSSDELRALRSSSIRSNLSAGRRLPTDEWILLRPFLDAMDVSASSVRMGIKRALAGYFTDLRCLLRNLKRVLVQHGQVVIVVGNSAYAKSIVPTDVLTARLAEEEGYRVESVRVARHLHVSSQQRSHLESLASFMRESVVVLEVA